MPTLFNLGSLNIDWVYDVPHIVGPGETLASAGRARFAGGKGANQSVAAARAGQRVQHVGCVGEDGLWLRDMLQRDGVGTEHLRIHPDLPTGHAVIQIDRDGENAIFLFPGANHHLDPRQRDHALDAAAEHDWVLLQNETGNARATLAAARTRGLRTAFNSAPVTDDLRELDLTPLHLLIVNETEAAAFTSETDPQAMVHDLGRGVQGWAVLTRGARGAMVSDGETLTSSPGHRVPTVRDTTGAGDTFIGYLVACLMADHPLAEALNFASAAAALSVAHPGAIPSIPHRHQVEAFLASQSF